MRDIRDLVERLRKNDAKAAVSTGQEPPFSIQGEAADEIERLRKLCSEAVERDATRWRKARMIFAVEDIERADAEMAGFMATKEENEKADAAIDAARDRSPGE